jgi:hypothetical protein
VQNLFRKIKSFFSRPVTYFTTKQNVLIIQAYPKKHSVAVSYKGKVVTGFIADNTLHNMLRGVRFRHNTESFLGAVAKLLEQLTKQ